MNRLNKKQYAAFSTHIKTLGLLRQNTVGCVPGDVHIQKVFILSGEDFDKLSEDISPEYPFIRENADLMSAWPGGRFDCLLVTTEDGTEGILAAEEGKRLYLAYVKDCHKLYIPKSCPREYLSLEEPKVYQEQAVFYHRPHRIDDINGQNSMRPVPERETGFRAEQVIVLADEQYRHFKEAGLMDDQIFLFDHSDRMWFDPGERCWHCVLVRGETSKDGILVDAEGYAYARYAAYAPDCDRLRLRGVPVHYEYPSKAPEQKKTRKRKEPER